MKCQMFSPARGSNHWLAGFLAAFFLGNATALAGEETTVVRIDPSSLTNVLSQPVTPSKFLTPDPNVPSHASTLIGFRSADGRLTVQVVGYDRAEFVVKSLPVDEFMYILEGKLEITDSSNVVHSISAGDAIVLPKGFTGKWKQLTPVKKISVFYVATP